MIKSKPIIKHLLALLPLLGISFMSLAQSYSSELDLKIRVETSISDFWFTGHFDSFQGVDDTRVNYASFSDANHQRCIVVVPGRSEGYLKYKELSHELFEQGYDVHIIDHRGQGISERLTKNPHKGYVKTFDDYSTDLAKFINTIIEPRCDKIYLLAHSMGGAIATRYMQQHESKIQASVLASPMIAINGGGIPSWLASFLIKAGDKLNSLFSDQPWYFLGQSDHTTTAFEDNKLSQSANRYQVFSELYTQTPSLQLGGVTFHWLAQAIEANVNIFNEIEKLKIPTLVLQAGNDTVVDNDAQNEFCQALHAAMPESCPHGTPTVIPGALHELFFEQDQYRDQAMSAVLKWFKQHNNSY
ncbi:alpha/beta fold hydrolase [Thalassotalea atypica]|uniref:alpha/beta fold hydrolase n=1 Tax=Thalassotalea atypica TaxID=2054316 RepID=UPI002573164F|nr:alpha/beta fold hydrolase [Thalassotalea atypica]